MLVLEGQTIFDKGKPVGKLELKEGQKSDVFCIVESCPGPLTEVATSDSDREKYKTLLEGEGSKPAKVLLTLEGVFQRSDTKNANNRIYPESIWKKVLEGDSKHLRAVSDGDMIGEADHPKDGETLMQRAAGRVTKLWRNPENDKEIMGRFSVFDTTRGRDLKAIHEGGGRLGVSSRGNGSVVRVDGKDVVQDDYDLQTWDVVYNPSTPGAYPKEVAEGTKSPGKKVVEAGKATRVNWQDVPHMLTEKVDLLERTARSPSKILETVASIKIDKNRPLHESMADARIAYRKLTETDGPLTEEESKAISMFVHRAYAGVVKVGSGPVTAKITWKGGALSESFGVAEIRAKTLEELRERMAERVGGLSGVVEVEIDRSEEVIEECTQRFSSLLEAQTSKAALLEQKVLEAEERVKRANADKTEISSKLLAAKDLITKFAARVKLAETKNEDLESTFKAAEALIEGIADEFKEEGIRSAVAAIAATHPEVEGLPDILAGASSLSEAVVLTNKEKSRHKSYFEREPLGIRSQKVEDALQKNAIEEKRKLMENAEDRKKSDSPDLTTTKTVVEALQERGLK